MIEVTLNCEVCHIEAVVESTKMKLLGRVYVTADGWQSEAESNGIDLCPSHATDIDDSFCPMCRMNVGESHDDAGCLAEAQAEGIAY